MRFLLHLAYHADLARERAHRAWRAWLFRRIDVDELILSCVPPGQACDPATVADAIREYFGSLEGGPAAWIAAVQEE